MLSRRRFIARTGLGSGLLCLGRLSPPAWAQAVAARPDDHGRMLVVIELDGGNDGLNTVVPYADDIYHRNRPTLRIKTGDVLKLDDHLGLHPAMTGLAKLWEAGQLRVVNNVGYPNPNRSHSRSLDIWRSGKLPIELTGWLGRAADQHHELSLCHVGDGAAPLAVRQRTGAGTSIGSLDDFRLHAGAQIAANESYASESYAAESYPDGTTLTQVAARLEAAAALANRIEHQARPRADKAIAGANDASQQSTPLAERLAVVRSLMEHDAGFRIFYTGTTGFDTHANQGFRHRRLLTEVSEALSAFLREIGKSDLGQRVIVLVFSEFGRRLLENGQQGTDHGAAAPVLLAGRPVRGGFLGGPPDLANLDDGDVAHKIDYRDLYASLLKQWLDIDPEPIMGSRTTSLGIL